MFQSLKQKIAKETGIDDVTKINFNKSSSTSINKSARNSISSNHSHSQSLDSSKDELSPIEEKEAEIIVLRQELDIAQNKIKELDDDNRSLKESLKLIQIQKNMVLNESDQIQNSQHQEIQKLKNLLLFREQESLDQLNKSKGDENQIDSLKNEISRIKGIEEKFETLQDEHENLRRSSQMESNQLITKLSAKEEEIRRLTEKYEISEQRAQICSSDSSENDKIKLLLQERRLLETRLEEAHIHLYEIKSNWTSQNLTLENQLQRLSRQVAEETAEKRKIIEAKEMLAEKVKQLEFDMVKVNDELKARDNKIKLMHEEIDELNSNLRELHLENEEEIEFLRSKVAYQESELVQTKENILKHSETTEDYEQQIIILQREKNEMLEKLKDNELRLVELNLKVLDSEHKDLVINDLQNHNDRLDAEVGDKTKAIKILNQRLFDVKKTLQEEIKNNNSGMMGSMTSNQPAILIPVNVDNNNHSLPFHLKKPSNISCPIVLDEVKFSYLKHVILKFLTTNSKCLIRPVSTLLYLTESEEKLLEEVIEYRKSWFGTKPNMSLH